MRTLYSNTLVRRALAQAARTNGTANGITVDLGVFANDFRTAMFVITTGTITDGSHAITVEDSPDGTNWTAVEAARVQGSAPTIVAADDDTVFALGYIVGTAQYVRLVATTSGATTGGVFSAVAILGEGSNNPVART